MTKQKRIEIIKKIEKERKSIVVCYVTSTRKGLEIKMADDCIRLLYDHLRKIDSKPENTDIDLFLYSHGGSGVVPWRLVNLLREFSKNLNVLVPFKAYSAATLTALGANKIVMHPMGELGPIDPSVANQYNPSNPQNPSEKLLINIEDVSSYLALIKEDVGINHEDELVQAFNILAQKIHPLALGNVKRFHSQSEMIAMKLLKKHMVESEEHQMKIIVKNLKSKLFFHGHPINRLEARNDLNLKVEFPPKKVEDLMWALYEEYEKELNMNEPFNPTLVINNKIKEINEKIKELNRKLNSVPQGSKEEAEDIKMEIGKLNQELQNMRIPTGKLKGAYIESRFLTQVFAVNGDIFKMLAQPPNQGHIIGLDLLREGWEVESETVK